MTLKIKTVLSTMTGTASGLVGSSVQGFCVPLALSYSSVQSANASSARSPVTVQGMGRLSSHPALPTTAEDGPADRAGSAFVPRFWLCRWLRVHLLLPLVTPTALPGPCLSSPGSELFVQFLI